MLIRVIPEIPRNVYSCRWNRGVVVALGKGLLKGEPPSFPPSEPLFPHPWSTTSTGNNVHLILEVVVATDLSRSHPRKNGAFLLGDGNIKGASGNEEICG